VLLGRDQHGSEKGDGEGRTDDIDTGSSFQREASLRRRPNAPPLGGIEPTRSGPRKTGGSGGRVAVFMPIRRTRKNLASLIERGTKRGRPGYFFILVVRDRRESTRLPRYRTQARTMCGRKLTWPRLSRAVDVDNVPSDTLSSRERRADGNNTLPVGKRARPLRSPAEADSTVTGR